MITYGEVEHEGITYLLTSQEYAHRVKRGMKLHGVQSRIAESTFGKVWTLYAGNKKIIGFEASAIIEHNKRAVARNVRLENEKTGVDMGYKIDTDMAIPTGRTSKGGSYGGYPFDKMEIGDSIFMPLKEADFEARPNKKTTVSELLQSRIRTYGYKYKKTIDGDFRRLVRERSKLQHNECGVRAWRVAKAKRANEE